MWCSLVPKIYSRYDVPSHPGSVNTDPSMTQQHFRDECDINNIIARYNKTGVLVDPLHPGTAQPSFGDFSSMLDYQEAQNIIIYANQAFALLPAYLRKRFNNEPAEMLQFLEKEENRDEAIKLGLVKRPSDPDPAPVGDFVFTGQAQQTSTAGAASPGPIS